MHLSWGHLGIVSPHDGQWRDFDHGGSTPHNWAQEAIMSGFWVASPLTNTYWDGHHLPSFTHCFVIVPWTIHENIPLKMVPVEYLLVEKVRERKSDAFQFCFLLYVHPVDYSEVYSPSTQPLTKL